LNSLLKMSVLKSSVWIIYLMLKSYSKDIDLKYELLSIIIVWYIYKLLLNNINSCLLEKGMSNKLKLGIQFLLFFLIVKLLIFIENTKFYYYEVLQSIFAKLSE